MLSRRSMMNDEIVSEEGKNLLLQKCKGSYLHGMKVYGRTTQEATTGAQLLDFSNAIDKENTESGVKATINGDGSYTLTGTALDAAGNLWFMGDYYAEESNPIPLFTLPAGTYTITGVNLYKYRTNIGGNVLGGNATFTIEEDTIITGVRNPALTVGQTYNETIYPMLNVGSELLTWEPYTGGVPSPNPDYPQALVSAGDKGSIEISVTDGADNIQSLVMLTPNGLRGIPVSSGGNYTDETGQQWIADYRDWERGVDVQMIDTLHGSSFSYNQIYNRWSAFANNVISEAYSEEHYRTVLCNIAIFSASNEANTCRPGALDNANAQLIYAPENTDMSKVVYMYQCNPIETPIPAEELSAYRALHTNTPTTTIINDEDCWMEVGYRRIRG